METGTTRQNGDGSQNDGSSPLRSEVTVEDETSTEGTDTSQENPSLQEQVKEVLTLSEVQYKEGDAGYVISAKWLGKAREQAEKGESEDDPLGPVDNSDLLMVVDPTATVLKDERGNDFVPMRPGLQIPVDYDIVPLAAWKKVIQWHGLAKGSTEIVRYTHDTSTNEFVSNQIFEAYPPVFTVLKLPPSPPTAAETSNPAPVKMLTSRSSSFQSFLKAAKNEAKIPLSTNVRVWRVFGPSTVSASAQPGVLTPANSRSASPIPNITVPIDLGKNMIIDVNNFLSLQEGSQRELLDINDETNRATVVDKSSCGDVGLGQEGIIVLEEQTSGPAGGEWITTIAAQRQKSGALIKSADGMLKPGGTASGRSSPTPSMTTRGRALKGRVKGTVGLGNLGNTCYMNSALQCVRACQELTEYFLDNHYKKELNPSNPLGNKGEVAKAYANLLRDIYNSNNSSSFTPRNFRSTIAKYNPQFSGYQQQDSQEFVLFLLDGLQEDLNRITKKPYIEKPDSTDEMVHDHDALSRFAEENWRIYKARNDSVITDLFAGMYKSTLQCPVCDKVSIIFDPFNNLTLQLPIENTWAKEAIFFPLHARPVKLIVEVEKSGTLADVRDFIAKKVDVSGDRLQLAEPYHHGFYKVFEDNDLVGDIRDSDVLAAYELEAKPTNWPGPAKPSKFSYNKKPDYADDSEYAEQMLVPIVYKTAGKSRQKNLFGWPSFITVNRDAAKSYDKILRKALNRLSTATTLDFLSDGNEEEEESDTVLMTAEDAESGSSEEKVLTTSIQGESDMVDISMRDTDDSAEAGVRIAYPPMTPIHKSLHTALREETLLPERLDQMFTMSLYENSSSSCMIPSGMSIGESTTTTLRKRQKAMKYQNSKEKKRPKNVSGKKVNLSARIASAGTPSDESEDELAAGLPPAAGAGSPQSRPGTADASAENSDSDDGVPQVQEATETLSKGYGELHVAKLVDYDTDSEPDEISFAQARKQKVVSNETSPEPLIRLGEGLVLEFEDDYYQHLFKDAGFEGSGLESGGTDTGDHMNTLPDPELHNKRTRRSRLKKEGVSLDDCLDLFGKAETLSANDAWYCPRCKEHRQATKTFELWKVPDILVIHIKRFSVQGRLRDKLDVKVNFPTEGLDLTERMKGKEDNERELVYDLFAVDNHYGGLGGGHYTAYGKNFMDDNWYYFDDSSTSPRNASDSVTNAAYLLFYRRRNSNVHLGGPNFDKVYASATDSSSTAADSAPTSRAASPGGYPGEGRRLGGSSRNGSSSAYLAAAAVHQAGGGGPEASTEAEQEQEGTQARIEVNGVNSEDEGYGGGADELPSYTQSQGFGNGMAGFGASSFSWPSIDKDQDQMEDDANSSTFAVDDNDDRSMPSAHFPGTPERMDEDAPELSDDVLPTVQSVRGRGVTPEQQVAEIRVSAEDDEMKTD